MTTTVQDPITEGSSYVVRFRNNVASTGVVVVIVAWVPNHERLVPGPQQMTVAPSATAELTGTVPAASNARRMVVVASLDARESGRLTVLENDTDNSIDDLTETTTQHRLVQGKA
jgi:hypothetical protein